MPLRMITRHIPVTLGLVVGGLTGYNEIQPFLDQLTMDVLFYGTLTSGASSPALLKIDVEHMKKHNPGDLGEAVKLTKLWGGNIGKPRNVQTIAYQSLAGVLATTITEFASFYATREIGSLISQYLT